MRGLGQLRIALSSVKTTAEPLFALTYVMQHRPPKDLDAVEGPLLRHLAAVEDALALVRNLKTREETPIERSVQRKEPDGKT